MTSSPTAADLPHRSITGRSPCARHYEHIDALLNRLAAPRNRKPTAALLQLPAYLAGLRKPLHHVNILIVKARQSVIFVTIKSFSTLFAIKISQHLSVYSPRAVTSFTGHNLSNLEVAFQKPQSRRVDAFHPAAVRWIGTPDTLNGPDLADDAARASGRQVYGVDDDAWGGVDLVTCSSGSRSTCVVNHAQPALRARAMAIPFS